MANAIADVGGIGLALADLISQSCGTVEEILRVQRRVVHLHVEIGEVIAQRLGLLPDIDAFRAE